MLALPDPRGAAPADEPPAEPKAALLVDAVAEVEREHILEALRETGWNVTRAAALLGISRDTLRHRIAKYALRERAARPTPRPAPLPAPAAPQAPAPVS